MIDWLNMDYNELYGVAQTILGECFQDFFELCMTGEITHTYDCKKSPILSMQKSLERIADSLEIIAKHFTDEDDDDDSND